MSISVQTKVVKQSSQGIEDFVKGVRKFMADKVDEVLQREIDKGNDVYTAEIDSKPINDRKGIYFATKSIRISFQKSASVIEIEKAKRALRTQLMAFYPYDKLNPTKYPFDKSWVTAWLCEKGQSATRITSDRVALTQNQYIAITVEIPSGQINPIPVANWLATRKHNKGFYERAARNIRTAFKVSRRGG